MADITTETKGVKTEVPPKGLLLQLAEFPHTPYTEGSALKHLVGTP